jgi:hypothetical protein
MTIQFSFTYGQAVPTDFDRVKSSILAACSPELLGGHAMVIGVVGPDRRLFCTITAVGMLDYMTTVHELVCKGYADTHQSGLYDGVLLDLIFCRAGRSPAC